MHFTSWNAVNDSTARSYEERTWESFLAFVAAPVEASLTEKLTIGGWSPIRCTGDRAKANVAAASCLVLDDDKSGLPLAAIVAKYGVAAGVVHSSISSIPELPKWRIVLRLSRDVTADEYARLWAVVSGAAAEGGQTLDKGAKDASRYWVVPARQPGGPYEWCELTGNVVDVDAMLAEVPAPAEPPAPAERTAAPPTDAQAARRRGQALALAAVWPPHGDRQPAKLALAGGLRNLGWSKDEARSFMETIRDAVESPPGDLDAECLNTTFSAAPGAHLAGWPTLAKLVDPVTADGAYRALAPMADAGAMIAARLAEAMATAKAAEAPAAADGTVTVPGFVFEVGGLDAPPKPINWQIGEFVARGEVVMLVAHGGSLKTWLAFSMALAVAAGRPWLGQYAAQCGRVGIIDFESGKDEVQRRLHLLGVSDATCGDRLLRSSYPEGDLTKSETWIALAALKLDLLVLDSFAAAQPGIDENDKRAADILQHAGRFAEHTGCTVIVIHHRRKGSGGDARENIRGSSAILAAVDRAYEFTELEEKPGKVFASTLETVKHGAKGNPAPIRVELSDAGLRLVPAAPKPETANDNEAIVLRTLRSTPAGKVKKAGLVKLLKGSKAVRDATIEQMLVADRIREHSEREGRNNVLFVRLSPL